MCGGNGNTGNGCGGGPPRGAEVGGGPVMGRWWEIGIGCGSKGGGFGETHCHTITRP